MKPLARNVIAKPLAMLLALILALLMPHGGAFAQDRSPFSQQQLEQTLAPIALYPDSLLSQILMASTYPLEVVEAARWSRSHSHLVGEDAVRAAENENWDPSVKSLLAFPQVLTRMDENLQWLQELGDAFLAQEPQVMDAVQTLRRRAQAAGNLRSDERQRVVASGPILAIVPAYPEVIYVPYYDPTVVYGLWGWPDYAPVYWRPFPGYYVAPGVASGFYWGPSIRISVGYFFGGFDWSHRHVRVVHTHSHYYHHSAAAHQRPSAMGRDRPAGAWQHDPVHRRGVAYRGPEVQQRFAAGENARADERKQRDREDVRRQTQQPPPSSPASSWRRDAGRPSVQSGVQTNAPAREQAAIQQNRQPYPTSRWQSESRKDPRRLEVRQDLPVQAASSQAAVPQPHSGNNARVERRDQDKDVARGDRREAVERRPAKRQDEAVLQTPWNRGNALSAHGDQTERSAMPQARESRQAPQPSTASREEAQKSVERRSERGADRGADRGAGRNK